MNLKYWQHIQVRKGKDATNYSIISFIYLFCIICAVTNLISLYFRVAGFVKFLPSWARLFLPLRKQSSCLGHKTASDSWAPFSSVRRSSIPYSSPVHRVFSVTSKCSFERMKNPCASSAPKVIKYEEKCKFRCTEKEEHQQFVTNP